MKARLLVLLSLVLGAVLIGVLLIAQSKMRGSTPRQMQIASNLLSLHHSMELDGVMGFLSGTNSLLNESLLRQRYTSVTVQPDFVVGLHMIKALGRDFGSSITVQRDPGTNTWTAWSEVTMGTKRWSERLGPVPQPQRPITETRD
jgi:hypothetical protein